jgi:hypothetical protein
MSKEAIKYYEENRIVGDYLDKASVVSMMNGFHRQEQAKQLILSGVSHRRELLIGWEKIQMCDNWAKQKQKRIEAIDYYLASN